MLNPGTHMPLSLAMRHPSLAPEPGSCDCVRWLVRGRAGCKEHSTCPGRVEVSAGLGTHPALKAEVSLPG
jgi:hypothetical protein